MNFSELHERLRLEILRRIHSGALTRSLLARQIGVKPAHISNFLLKKRALSLRTMDKILEKQNIPLITLFPPARSSVRDERAAAMGIDHESVPLVTYADAMHAVYIVPGPATTMVKVRREDLMGLREKCSPQRRKWQRFVAVHINDQQASPMKPVLSSRSILIIDRHYNSLIAYDPARPSIYAIKRGPSLRIRYATFESDRIILRPHNRSYPIEMIAVPSGQSLSDFVVGRVCQLVAEI